MTFLKNDDFRGMIGGIIAGLFMGVFSHQFASPDFPGKFALNLYGIPTAPVFLGWAIHLIHSALVGLFYVRTIDGTDIRRVINPRTFYGGLFHGFICGVMFGLILGWVIYPVWLHLVGSPLAPPIPNVQFPSSLYLFLGHILYGLILGVFYALGAPDR